jgi:predicted PurR-regulated permease PerM
MLTADEQGRADRSSTISTYNIGMAISDRVKKTPKKTTAPEDFGSPGAPINRAHPFYFGFLATSGGLVALMVLRSLAAASQIFVLLIIALFFAAGLNPAVEAIRRRGLSRARSVAIIFAAVMLFVGLFVWLVIPPVISQGSQLIRHAPTLLSDLKHNSTIATLNDHYGIIDSIQKKLAANTSNGTLLVSAFGGVVGVGKTVLSGTFSALTVLILTLYFLTSLPQIISMGLRLAPASRRDRLSRLTHGILNRIGTYIGSQITVALISGFFILILSASLGLPSPFALGMVVFVLDLLPLVGHSIGIVLITIIALTQSPLTALIAFLGYLLYIQIENYLITPKIMHHSLSVPGLVTIVAALIGATLLGLVGALLAVPMAASALLILDEVVFPQADSS